MYLTNHPYTGQDLRVLGPSPYANLGLGMSSPAAGETVDPFSGHVVMSNPTQPANLNLVKLLKRHPQLSAHLRRQAIRQKLTPGNTPASKGITGLGQDDGSADYGPGIPVYTGTSLTTAPSFETLPVTTSPTIASTSACPGCVQIGSNTFDPSNPLNAVIDSSGNIVAQGGASTLQNVLSQVISTAGKLTSQALTPGGSYTMVNPLTGQTVTYTGTGTSTSTGIPGLPTTIDPTTLLLLAAGGLVLVLVMAGGRH